jgi:hypothetical protein
VSGAETSSLSNVCSVFRLDRTRRLTSTKIRYYRAQTHNNALTWNWERQFA